MDRTVKLTAIKNASVEENLKSMGFSSALAVSLRKRLGLIYLIDEFGIKKSLRTIDVIDSGQEFFIVSQDNSKRIIPKYEYVLKIAYQDQDYAVIDKPSGMAVISTKKHYGKSLENALANMWGENYVYRPINRLDRDTSGLMVVAKSQLAHSMLSPQDIHREYLALVEGKMPQSGTIDAPIALESLGGMKRIVRQDGKQATTHYQSIKSCDTYSLVKFRLESGRTHQIRVHCNYIGHSVCCDKLYNPNPQKLICDNGFVLDRQALHSYYVSFTNPITKKTIQCNSIPEFVDKDIITYLTN